MSPAFSDLFRIAAITILITTLWGLSVAATYWDTHRRGLSGRSALVWLGLVTLLPIAGFVLYLLARSVTVLLHARGANKGLQNRRETALKEAQSKQSFLPTLHASNLAMETIANPQAAMPPQTPVERAPARYRFSTTAGPDRGKEFIVSALPARIGRGVEVEIRLDKDLGVSRQQAEIYQEDGELRIYDLSSTHGTKVNGIRIEDIRLEAGDRIQVGQSTIVIAEIEE
jgi:hypothetical protein